MAIFIKSATGPVRAFEKEIIAWVERDVRNVTAPTGIGPYGLEPERMFYHPGEALLGPV